MVMIRELRIRNFRGVKAADITDLGQINLFVGRNNTGKSTILDAISIYQFMLTTRIEFLRNILDRRATRTSGWLTKELFSGYDQATNASVLLAFNDGESTDVVLQRNVTTALTQGQLMFRGAACMTLNLYDDLRLANVTQNNLANIPISTVNFLSNLVLIDASIIKKTAELEQRFLTPAKEMGEDDKISEAYSQIYGEKVPRWEALSYQGIDFRVALQTGGRRIYLDDIGDGGRYGFAIISMASILRNTTLLIEEIENHQHPSAVRSLLDRLTEIAKSNNLQLFITTHSPDVFRYLARYESVNVYGANRDQEGKVAVYALSKKSIQFAREIGWDYGDVLRYQKFIIVEGSDDVQIVRHGVRKLRGYFPEEFGLTVVAARGVINVNEVVKAISFSSKEYFVLRDIDDLTREGAKRAIIDSFSSLTNEGYAKAEDENRITLTKGDQRLILEKNNILTAGNEESYPKIKRHSIEDYIIETLGNQPELAGKIQAGLTLPVLDKKLSGESSKDVLMTLIRGYGVDLAVRAVELSDGEKLSRSFVELVAQITK